MQATLFYFEHWKQDQDQLHDNLIQTQYLTNIGLGEPQMFYDANESLDIAITPTMVAYNSVMNLANPIGPNSGPQMLHVPLSELPIKPPFVQPQNDPNTDNEEPYYFDPQWQTVQAKP